jgi:hypothetical protein
VLLGQLVSSPPSVLILRILQHSFRGKVHWRVWPHCLAGAWLPATLFGLLLSLQPFYNINLSK